MQIDPEPLLTAIFEFGQLSLLDKVTVNSTGGTEISELRQTREWYDAKEAEANRIADQLYEMGLKPSANVVREFARECRSGSVMGIVSSQARSVIASLKGELEGQIWVTTDKDGRRYIDANFKEVFGEHCFPKFKDLADDMKEACLCFALDRNTACVNHLMRVTEGALRRMARALNVSGSDPSGKPLGWQHLANDMTKKLKGTIPGTPAAKRRHEARMLVMERFHNLVKTRNGCAHPDVRYDRQEAKEFMVHVPVFISQVARAI